MRIKRFIVNPFQMNCYIYFDETSGNGVIIDPGVYSEAEKSCLRKYITDNGITITSVINTHGHIDHVLGNAFAKDLFNVHLYLHKEDRFLLESVKEQGVYFGIDIENLPEPDGYLDDNSVIPAGDSTLAVLHTPGHSPGGICLIDHKNKIVFSGDSIFRESIGRTDLPGGNSDILINSIKGKLFTACKDDYIIYPGHMEETTIGHEKSENPFL